MTVAGFFAFAGKGWWRETQEFVILFDESIQGLERGSSVRLKGVRIGSVSNITVRYDAGTGVRAQVICEVDRSRVFGPRGEEIDLRRREGLEYLIDQGLGARLNLVGITGMLFVELDFFPELVADGAPDRARGEHPMVPAVPSVMTAMVDNVAEIVRRLEAIDFAGIEETAVGLLERADMVLAEARIPELAEQMIEAAGRVNAFMESDEIGSTLESVRAAFDDLGRVVSRLDEQIDPVAESVVGSAEEFQKALREAAEVFARIDELAGPRFGLAPQAVETLSNLNEAARSIQRLADFLERNPQAILSGRREERR